MADHVNVTEVYTTVHTLLKFDTYFTHNFALFWIGSLHHPLLLSANTDTTQALIYHDTPVLRTLPRGANPKSSKGARWSRQWKDGDIRHQRRLSSKRQTASLRVTHSSQRSYCWLHQQLLQTQNWCIYHTTRRPNSVVLSQSYNRRETLNGSRGRNVQLPLCSSLRAQPCRVWFMFFTVPYHQGQACYRRTLRI